MQENSHKNPTSPNPCQAARGCIERYRSSVISVNLTKSPSWNGGNPIAPGPEALSIGTSFSPFQTGAGLRCRATDRPRVF